MSDFQNCLNNLILKKFQGIGYTSVTSRSNEEKIGSSAPIILSSKIWAQPIPDLLGASDRTLVGTFNDSTNTTVIGTKYSITGYSYIYYYQNVILTDTGLTPGIAYKATSTFSGIPNLLVNSILTLGVTLRDSNDNIIYSNDSTNPWFIDSGTGYLTILRTTSSNLSLKASFYRYEGTLGAGVTGITNVSGNIGIATAVPTTALHVTGTTTSTTFNASSDYRLKSNITSITRTVDLLKPIEYDFVCESHDMGFLAHEVQEYFPFLVNGEKDGENMQSINYNGFIALLVKEVQDLKSTVKTLQNRIEILESK